MCVYGSQDGLEVHLPMAGLVDKEKERARLEKQAAKLTKDIEMLETRLSGSNFVEKVKEESGLATALCEEREGTSPRPAHWAKKS